MSAVRATHDDSQPLGLWQRLAAPLPPGAIKQRQGPGGRMLDYVDWPVVQDRLDAVVPGEWDLKLEVIPGTQGGEDPFAVKATLAILGVVRENIGAGKDWKDAATDASKRAAVRFGIGLELYRDHGTPRPQVVRPSPHSLPSMGYDNAPDGTEPQSFERGAVQRASDEPSCPKCGGKMWDNRATKRNPRAPDFKCRNRQCDGVIWPEKATPTHDDAPDFEDRYDNEPPF